MLRDTEQKKSFGKDERYKTCYSTLYYTPRNESELEDERNLI